MNTDHLVTFLETLEPDQSHEFYWSGLHPDGQRLQAYGTLEDMLPKLHTRNLEGFGIFISVNAIDVPSYEGGYPRRRNIDITRVRSCFADWDDPNAELPEWPLEPTMIVETSERKYHIHWCVNDCPLGEFEAIQRGIAQTMGSDPSVHDLARELRPPGFLHTKDLMNPTPIELVEMGGPRYSVVQLREAFPFDATKVRPKFGTWNGTDIERKARLTHAVIAAHYGERPDGGFNIRCPWSHEHTTPDTLSCSTYWPPSEKNDGRGSYVCKHAHCQGRMVDELDAWVSKQTATFLV